MISVVGGVTAVVMADGDVTYADAEAALRRQGFESFLIDRSFTGGRTELALSAYVPTDKITAESVPKMDATKTFRAMAEVLAELDQD